MKKIKDIEDISEQICPKSGKTCGGTCGINEDWCLVNMNNTSVSDLPKKICLADGRLWFAVSDIRSIFAVLDDVGHESYMLVAGNTAKGNLELLLYALLITFKENNLLFLYDDTYFEYRSILGNFRRSTKFYSRLFFFYDRISSSLNTLQESVQYYFTRSC